MLSPAAPDQLSETDQPSEAPRLFEKSTPKADDSARAQIVWLLDLGSSNGTCLNGRRVSKLGSIQPARFVKGFGLTWTGETFQMRSAYSRMARSEEK